MNRAERGHIIVQSNEGSVWQLLSGKVLGIENLSLQPNASRCACRHIWANILIFHECQIYETLNANPIFFTFCASDSEVMRFNRPPFTLRVFFMSGVLCHLSRLFCYLHCTNSKIFQIVCNLWKHSWHIALPHPSGN